MKPTLEEVKEYFKDADIVESIYGTMGTPEGNFHFEDEAYFCNYKLGHLALWKESMGYAKILTYKTPKYEITKEQVIMIEPYYSAVKFWFPDVFKKPFTGWAKDTSITNEKWLAYFENGFMKYGIGADGNWFVKENGSYNFDDSENHIEATSQEVEDALIGEANKRGFVNGAIVYRTQEMLNLHRSPSAGIDVEIENNEFDYDYLSSSLTIDGRVIFIQGKWAEIIETITIKEAEKLLKKQGINKKIV